MCREVTTELMLITLPPSLPNCLTASCVARMRPSTLMLNCAMELFLRHRFEWLEFVDAGVVHQDVDLPECLLRGGEQPLDVRLLRDISLHRDCLAAALRDLVDDAIGVAFRAGVVNDHRRAFRGQLSGDIGADSFRAAGNDGDFAREFLCGHAHKVKRMDGAERLRRGWSFRSSKRTRRISSSGSANNSVLCSMARVSPAGLRSSHDDTCYCIGARK